MKVPSGELKQELSSMSMLRFEPDIEYVLLLDFEASKSVVKAGSSGMYLLKPVIRAKEKAITGNIAGTVNPAGAKPVVYAIADSDTLSSTVIAHTHPAVNSSLLAWKKAHIMSLSIHEMIVINRTLLKT
ncbi:MAG: hypothetical protein U5J63_02220 [Fodinibius sp.]|nr:hypothetical protein [Fodinibius sp.]